MRRSLLLVAVVFAAAVLLLLTTLPERGGRDASSSPVAPRARSVPVAPARSAPAETTSIIATSSGPLPAAAQTAAATSDVLLRRVRGRLVDKEGHGVARATVRLFSVGVAAATTATTAADEPRVWPRTRPLPGERHCFLGEGTSSLDGRFAIAPVATSLGVGACVFVSAVAWVGTTLATEGSDAYRHFELARRVPGARIRVERSSYGTSRTGLVDDAGDLDVGELQLRPRCLVTVQVRVNGAPASNIRVSASTYGKNGAWWPGTTVDEATDERGVARFDGPLLEGEMLGYVAMGVSVKVPGFAAVSRDVALGSAGVELPVDLVTEALLAGRVLDSAGRPVADARIYAHGGDGVAVKSDAEGRYTVRGLAPGRVELDVSTGRVELADERRVVVEAPSTTADVTLLAAATLVVTVANAPAGLSFEHVDRHVNPDIEEEAKLARATFASLHPGEHRVLVRAPGFVPTLSPVIALGAGEHRDLPLTLDAARTVKGRVVGEDGRPIRARVSFVVEGVKIVAPVPMKVWRGGEPEPKEDGVFASDELPVGDVELTFGQDGYVPRVVRVPSGVAELAEPVVLVKAKK